MPNLSIVPDPKRGKAAHTARVKRYELMEAIEAVIHIYEERIVNLKAEKERLRKMNQ